MEHRVERWVVNAIRVYHLIVRSTFQRKSPRTVTRTFQRNNGGVGEVAAEHFFVTSKGNTNCNPRTIAEDGQGENGTIRSIESFEVVKFVVSSNEFGII